MDVGDVHLVEVRHVVPGEVEGVPGGDPVGDDVGVVGGQGGVAHQLVEVPELHQGRLEVVEVLGDVEARYIFENLKNTVSKKH